MGESDETVGGGQADASDERTNQPQRDTAKVQIRRVAGVDPVTELAYIPFSTPERDARPHSSGYEHWQPDSGVSVFEVSAEIASAAVATGAFEVTEESRVKLRKRGNAYVVEDEAGKEGA